MKEPGQLAYEKYRDEHYGQVTAWEHLGGVAKRKWQRVEAACKNAAYAEAAKVANACKFDSPTDTMMCVHNVACGEIEAAIRARRNIRRLFVRLQDDKT